MFYQHLMAFAQVGAAGNILKDINDQDLSTGFLSVSNTGPGQYKLELEYDLPPQYAEIRIFPVNTNPGLVSMFAPILYQDINFEYKLIDVTFSANIQFGVYVYKLISYL